MEVQNNVISVNSQNKLEGPFLNKSAWKFMFLRFLLWNFQLWNFSNWSEKCDKMIAFLKHPVHSCFRGRGSQDDFSFCRHHVNDFNLSFVKITEKIRKNSWNKNCLNGKKTSIIIKAHFGQANLNQRPHNLSSMIRTFLKRLLCLTLAGAQGFSSMKSVPKLFREFFFCETRLQWCTSDEPDR